MNLSAAEPTGAPQFAQIVVRHFDKPHCIAAAFSIVVRMSFLTCFRRL